MYKKIGSIGGGSIDIVRDRDGDIGLCRCVDQLNESVDGDGDYQELFYLSIGHAFTVEQSLEKIRLAAQGTPADRVLAAARRAVASEFDREDCEALESAVEALADSEDE